MGMILKGCTDNCICLIKVLMFKTLQITVNIITINHKFKHLLPVKDQNHFYCDLLKKQIDTLILVMMVYYISNYLFV